MIPGWNAQGVLPPVRGLDGTSRDRSPYTVSLQDVVLQFGTSPSRLSILSGLLEYRASLHAAGVTQGFQWLDGSFMENVEAIEGRPPNDIDVVTFLRVPSGMTQLTLAQQPPFSFDRLTIKQTYHVDAYYCTLDAPPDRLIGAVIYWYSLWSHRRNVLWKGYLQVDLAPAEDVAARTALTSLRSGGLQP